jgi:hypothetical protein
MRRAAITEGRLRRMGSGASTPRENSMRRNVIAPYALVEKSYQVEIPFAFDRSVQ